MSEREEYYLFLGLIVAAIGAIIAIGWAVWFVTTDPAADCPAAKRQLNPYEYELQRRTCEAVNAGAIEQQQRRRP